MVSFCFRGFLDIAFGSYGWSGEAVRLINQELRSMKFDLIDEGLRVQFVPDKDALKKCKELGKRLASALKNI